jgi:hypothetical protein
MLLACTTSPESFLLAFVKLDSQETESLADKKQVNLPFKKIAKARCKLIFSRQQSYKVVAFSPASL